MEDVDVPDADQSREADIDRPGVQAQERCSPNMLLELSGWTLDQAQGSSTDGPSAAAFVSPARAFTDTSVHRLATQGQRSPPGPASELPDLNLLLPNVSVSCNPVTLIPQSTKEYPYCTLASHLALPMLGFSTQDAPVSITIADAIQHLPEYEEAEIKMSWYLKSIAWYCAPMSVEDTVKLVNEVYQIRETGQLDILDIDQEYHKVAVVFIILALGTLMDMELQPHSPEAKQYCSIAQHCLGSGHHVTRHTPYALQALVGLSRCDVSTPPLINQSLMAKFVV